MSKCVWRQEGRWGFNWSDFLWRSIVPVAQKQIVHQSLKDFLFGQRGHSSLVITIPFFAFPSWAYVRRKERLINVTNKCIVQNKTKQKEEWHLSTHAGQHSDLNLTMKIKVARKNASAGMRLNIREGSSWFSPLIFQGIYIEFSPMQYQIRLESKVLFIIASSFFFNFSNPTIGDSKRNSFSGRYGVNL